MFHIPLYQRFNNFCKVLLLIQFSLLILLTKAIYLLSSLFSPTSTNLLLYITNLITFQPMQQSGYAPTSSTLRTPRSQIHSFCPISIHTLPLISHPQQSYLSLSFSFLGFLLTHYCCLKLRGQGLWVVPILFMHLLSCQDQWQIATLQLFTASQLNQYQDQFKHQTTMSKYIIDKINYHYIMSGESVNDYRIKIKKLKYKIQKQEKTYNQLRQSHQQFKNISKNQLQLKRVLNKINFLLQLKGLYIDDWFNSVSYESGPDNSSVRLSDLLNALQQMGIHLEAGQKFLLQNSANQNMSDMITKKQLLSFSTKFGIRTSSS